MGIADGDGSPPPEPQLHPTRGGTKIGPVERSESWPALGNLPLGTPRLSTPEVKKACMSGAMAWRRGSFSGPPSPPRVEPGGGSQANHLLSLYQISGHGIDDTVAPNVSAPLPSSGVHMIPWSDPLWRNRVGK